MPPSTPSPLVKQTVNGLLERLAAAGAPPQRLPSEAELAQSLDVSRSTLRKAVAILEARGLISRDGSVSLMVRRPLAGDRFTRDCEPSLKTDDFATFFLGKINGGDFRAGARFSELSLSQASGLTTVTVREGLLRFARFGLIHKEPRQQWRVAAFDAAMIDELFDLRVLLEQAALSKALSLPPGHALRLEFAELLAAHLAFTRRTRHPVDEFRLLDERFHAALFAAAGNRYLDEMFSAISLLIHFQLAHATVGRRGMELGLVEHPLILDALVAGDAPRARAALGAHLASARSIMKLAAGAAAAESRA